MPDYERLADELELCEALTAGFVNSIVRAARQIPDDRWNWSFGEQTPTAREICEHTFMWLWCDRQQMTVPDRERHLPVPDLPGDREGTIRLLVEEADAWRSVVRSLTPEELDEMRESWPGETRTVRSFFFHMGQHIIFKAGQIWMLHYGLGLDGSQLYTAPHPSDYGFPEAPPWPSPRS